MQAPLTITKCIAAVGVLVTLIAWAFLGERVAVGAAVGSVIALSYWSLTRWIGKKILTSDARGRAGIMTLLVVKMAALMGLCWVLVARLHIHALGFAMGWTALVAGALIGASLSAGSTNVSTTVTGEA